VIKNADPPKGNTPTMTTSRERVLQALNFQQLDRVPRDLGGMRSTSISVFAYPRLVAAVGLPPRLPRVGGREVVPVMADGGGYVFRNIHNQGSPILAAGARLQ
jgi:hypothetical protein